MGLVAQQTSTQVQALGLPLEPQSVTETGNVHSANVSTLCVPILGTGKAVGIPIQVKGEDGVVLNDLSGLTFLIVDGTSTQDVTELIQTPAQQPLWSPASQPDGWLKPYFRSSIDVPRTIDIFSVNRLGAATSSPLVLENPGYFFLSCSPDTFGATGPTFAPFDSGVELKVFDGSTLVSKASVAGRGAINFGLLVDVSGNPLLDSIMPSDASDADFGGAYRAYLNTVGIALRHAFAEAFVAHISMDRVYGELSCADDLVTVSGDSSPTWSWTPLGNSFISELVTPASGDSSTAFPIMTGRTLGTGSLMGPVGIDVNNGNAVVPICQIPDNPYLDVQYLFSYLTAQLLLIDGPRGNVPTSISDVSPAFRAATVLEPVVLPTPVTVAPTTTTSPVSTTTLVTQQTTSANTTPTTTTPAAATTASPSTTVVKPVTAVSAVKAAEIPATGSELRNLLGFAVFVSGAGMLIVVTSRRRRFNHL